MMTHEPNALLSFLCLEGFSKHGSHTFVMKLQTRDNEIQRSLYQCKCGGEFTSTLFPWGFRLNDYNRDT